MHWLNPYDAVDAAAGWVQKEPEKHRADTDDAKRYEC